MFKLPRLTPESLMILSLTAILDAIGLILFCYTLDDYGILDIVSICTVGAWSAFKAGRIPPSSKKKGFVRRVFTGRMSRFIVTFGGEMIPYLGGAFCFLTLGAYHLLMQQDEMLAERKRQIENAQQSQ